MNIHGILILDMIAIALIFLIMDQVRRDRLYVGYGVLLVVAIAGGIAMLSIPGLLPAVTQLVGAVYPASALALLAFCFIVFMLIYILTQLTLLSNRLARVIQELAIERAKQDHEMRMIGTHHPPH